MEINHIESEGKGTFVAVDDDIQLGEIAYNMNNEGRLVITQTGVEAAAKGRGVGRSLVYKVADYARVNQLKIVPICPFAKSIFDRHRDIQDVLA